VKARNADTASSNQRSVIHISAGTRKNVNAEKGNVSAAEPNQTQSPDMRP
jgi:hypothetical protein